MKTKRILSIVLTLAMLLGMLPGMSLTASAEGNTTTITSPGTTGTMTITLTIAEATHSVTITAGENMTNTGNASQTGLSGAMTDVVYTAADGYYFPENYVASCTVTANSGVSVTRDSYTQIKVSGTPTADAEITLPAPTAKTDQTAPTGLTATKASSSTAADGKISNVTDAMEYQIDGATTWTAVGENQTEITGLTAGTYKVRYAGTADKNASPEATVEVDVKTNQDAPTGLTATKASSSTAADGKISGVTAAMEYQIDGASTWTAVENNKTEITGLTAGTYKVRYAETADKNASPAATVEVGTKTDQEAPTGLTATKASSSTAADGKISGVNDDMEYQKNDTSTWTAVGAGKTEITGLTAGTYKVRYVGTADKNASPETTVTIGVKEDQTAPTGLTATKASSSTAADGKISGVTDAMEYQKNDTSTWTAVGAGKTEITGLTAGTYKVRYVGTADKNASPATNVEVGTKTDQEAPTGLTATKASSSTATDGKISGVTDAMEYQIDGASTWTAVENNKTEITGLTAGTYKVRYAETADKNASPAANVEVGTKTDQEAPTGLTATKASSSTATDGKISGVTDAMEYQIDGASTWTAVENNKTEITGLTAGTYKVRYAGTADKNASPAANVEVGVKVAPTVTAPTAKTLTYNGQAQALVTAGEATGGTMQYALGTKDAATEEYTTSIPKGTDAGTYYVWYKIVGDSNHNDTEPASVTVTISKINPTYTIPTGLTATYGQTLANVTLPENWAWVNNTTSVGNAGTNSFSAIFTPTDTTNYNTVTVNASVSVNKAAGSISYATASVNETYGNAAFTNELTKTGDGTVTYATSNNAVVTVADDGKVTIVGVGEATITATVTDGTNYAYEVKSASYSVSVAKANGSIATAISTDNMSWSSDFVFIEGTAGQEYIIVPKGTEITAESWQSSLKPDAERDNWVFFTELIPATEYVIYTRTAETDTHNSGEPVNANVHTDLECIEKDFDSDLLGAEFTVKTEPETEGLTYKWYLDTVTDNGEGGENHELTEIADATGSSYTFRDADVGKHIAVKIFRGESEVGETNTDFAIAAAATVTFDSKGGREAEPQTGLSYNSKVTEPEGITRSGYILAGWYADEEYDIKWDFDADTVKWADTTLYAKWTPIYVAPAATTVAVPVSGDSGEENVSVKISGDKAILDSITDAQIANTIGEDGKSFTIDLTGMNGSYEFEISKAAGEKIADAVGEDGKAVIWLKESSGGTDAFYGIEAPASFSKGSHFWVRHIEPTDSTLTDAVRDYYFDNSQHEQWIIDAGMTSDGKEVHDLGGDTVNLYIAVGDDWSADDMRAVYISEDGKTENVVCEPETAVNQSGEHRYARLELNHFSTYILRNMKDCPISEFTDADANAWYHDGVHFVLENKLMSGYGNGKFGPADNTSRAMVAQILWNMEGKPASSYEMNYTDVADDAWYANAIRWATEKGIVTGYGDGKFGPDDNITREQLAAIIYRYAQSKGQGFTGMWMFNLDYEDASDISDWASEAMHWMVMKGIIKGQTDKALSPKSFASRAEIATMIMRYVALEK